MNSAGPEHTGEKIGFEIKKNNEFYIEFDIKD